MTFADADLEAIVREVLRRLPLAAAAAPRRMAEGSASSEPVQAAAPPTLELHEKVITLARLEGRLADIQHIRVSAGAILTPAVRDELKRRSITWSRRHPADPSTRSAPAGQRLLLVVDHAAPLARSIEQQARGLGVRMTVAEIANSADMQTRLQAELALSDRAAVLSSRPFAVTCELNRQESFCAAQACRVEDVQRARMEMDLNVLVLDARRLSAGQAVACLRQLLQDA